MAELSDRSPDVHQDDRATPADLSGLRCAPCGATALRLVYVVCGGNEERATPAFWCDACPTGLVPGPAAAPPGAVEVPAGEEEVPDYRVVLPS